MRNLYLHRNLRIEFGKPENSVFKIFIAYEDAAARCRSVALLKRMSSVLGCPCDQWLQVTMWNFGKGEFPPKMVIQEAAQAETVFVAACERDVVPNALAEWINCWSIKRADTPCALVALLELHGKNPEGGRGILFHLEQTACTQNLAFFAELSERDSANSSSRILPGSRIFQKYNSRASRLESFRNQSEQEEEL